MSHKANIHRIFSILIQIEDYLKKNNLLTY